MKDFINYHDMYETLKQIYTESVDADTVTTYWDALEDWADMNARQIIADMRKYVHFDDTRLMGNFCNIREDWEITPDFIGSDVKPWGKFDDMVKSMDDDTISDEDAAKVQQWCMDWFFRAFGTYNLEYNFQSYIADLEYEAEQA